LDEAIAHLDAKLRHSIRATLKGYQEHKGVTTLYATPDQLDGVAMADRMLVIDSGRLQQIGTADEVYQFPENQFVATLVGYPQMNVFSVRVVSEEDTMVLKIDGANLRVPGKIKTVVEKKANDPQIRLGIRPMDFALKPIDDRETTGLTGEIRIVEHYGDYLVYSIQSGDHFIKVKTEAEIEAKVGEKIHLDPDMDAAYVFSADGEATIWPTRD
jgi:ABC-type sugar transport system ATPase subunit